MNSTIILEKLLNGTHLTAQECRLLLFAMSEGNVSTVQIAAILTALRIKGETPDEISGFIHAMREKMIPMKTNGVIDVCGTGGDGSQTFNISTAVAFVAAGAGAKVAKHGNRAASSSCGSADVLEALGTNIHLNPKDAQKILKKVGIVFLFAPLYHPAMKLVAQTRKELGIRTIFNVLGPFCNPASVRRQIIGVPNVATAQVLALAAKHLSYVHLCILTSEGMDEASTFINTTVFEVKGSTVKKFTLKPKMYGFGKSLKKKLLGGSAQVNAKIINDVLEGNRGPHRDIVVFNSALALYVAGIVTKITEGIKLAKTSIDSGVAKAKLLKLIAETRKYV